MIFDIGGVFIGLDFSRAIHRTAAAVRKTPDDVRRCLFGKGDPMVDRKSYMNDYECGLMDEFEFHRCIEELLQAPLPFAEFQAAWIDIFLEPIHETIRIAEHLRALGEVKLGILSNNNTMHWAAIQPVLPVLKNFDHVFLSHQIGMKKPDSDAFHHALRAMNIDASVTIFVDDLAENIAAARQIGIKTIHATNSKAVREGFAAHGMKIDG